MKIKGIRHVGIETRNLKKMISFYEDLGMTLFYDKTVKPKGLKQKIKMVKLVSKDGSVIELTQGHINSYHIAFDTDNKEDLIWLKDPDGNLLEIVNEKLL